MPARSSGLLMYRYRDRLLEVFLVHPGGPFWAKKDAGAWSIPKGEFEEHEDPLLAAKREFEEETGSTASGNFLPLTPVKQRGRKMVHAWAVEGDCDPATVKSNTTTIEWPPRSGKRITIPEIDRAEWFALPAARSRINPGQLPLLDELARILNSG